MSKPYMIHVQLGDKFWDLYVLGLNEGDALREAVKRFSKEQGKSAARWATFTA
jgi:hypothetical protein